MPTVNERAPMKTCSKCGEAKPLDDYSRNSHAPDGREWRCKVCVRASSRAYYAANREVHVAYSRKYREKDPTKVAEGQRRRNAEDPQRVRAYAVGYRQRHPTRVRQQQADYCRRNREKSNAHSAVNNAKKAGKLIPALACERCGHDFSVYRREAHHEDYTKRLEVEWLCSLCHKTHHREVA